MRCTRPPPWTAPCRGLVRHFLETTFGAHGPGRFAQARPFGFVEHDFGNAKGGAGFVLYRASGGRIASVAVAVPGGDIGWARPLVGAVALSMRCASPGAPKEVPRDPALLATRISIRCIQGQCGETDFAATYLSRVLRFGYVHNPKGEMFLQWPQRDFWQNAEGAGLHHQIGGRTKSWNLDGSIDTHPGGHENNRGARRNERSGHRRILSPDQ